MIALNQPHHFHSFSHDGFRSGALGPVRHGGGVSGESAGVLLGKAFYLCTLLWRMWDVVSAAEAANQNL